MLNDSSVSQFLRDNPELWFIALGIFYLLTTIALTYSLSKRDVDYGPLRPAALRRRVLAAVVDLACLGGIALTIHSFVFAAPFSLAVKDEQMARALLIEFLVLIVMNFFVFAAFFSSSWQGTLGMKIFGIAIVDQVGERLSFGKAVLRQFGSILTLQWLGYGYLAALFTLRSQTLHDLMATTLVVRSRDL